MNYVYNRHSSDGKLKEKEERVTTSDFENDNTEKNLSNNTIQKENNLMNKNILKIQNN